MKTISFILQQKATLSLVDWNSLLNAHDPNMILILISEQGCVNALKKQFKKRFTAIIALEQFEFAQATQEMDKLFSEHYQSGDKTHIATLHEFQQELVAQLREHYRVTYNTQGPGIEVIQNFRNKLLMKEHLGPKGITLPKYTKFDSLSYKKNPEIYLQSIEELLGFPMFVKPIDSAGSINTAYIQNKDSLKTWCDKASKSNDIYEIDEFIDGTLFHCDSVIKNGQVQFTLVAQYLHPNADAFSGKALATMTLNPDLEIYGRLKQFAEKALSHFPILPDGITHLEVFKRSSNNELVFLEVAARAPGGVAPEMYKVRTGVDIRQLHLRLNLGLNIEESLEKLNDRSQWGPFASMYQLVAPYQGGTISKLEIPVFHGGGFTTDWRCREGDNIKPASSIANVIVSTVFWNEDYEAFEHDFLSLDTQCIVFWHNNYSRCHNLAIEGNDLHRKFKLQNVEKEAKWLPKSSLNTGFFKAISATSTAAAVLLPKLEGQPNPDTRYYSAYQTEIDPGLFWGLLVGSAVLVIMLFYAVPRLLSKIITDDQEDNVSENIRSLQKT